MAVTSPRSEIGSSDFSAVTGKSASATWVRRERLTHRPRPARRQLVLVELTPTSEREEGVEDGLVLHDERAPRCSNAGWSRYPPATRLSNDRVLQLDALPIPSAMATKDHPPLACSQDERLIHRPSQGSLSRDDGLEPPWLQGESELVVSVHMLPLRDVVEARLGLAGDAHSADHNPYAGDSLQLVGRERAQPRVLTAPSLDESVVQPDLRLIV